MVEPFSFREDPAVPDFDDLQPVAVMDAECALCSWGARMIHRLDRTGTVRICPIQSPLGAALLRHYGLEREDPSSWLFIDGGGGTHVDCDAVLQAGRRLGGWTRMAGVLRIFPRPVRNWLYRRFARNRYALFGRAVSIGVEECPLIGVQKGPLWRCGEQARGGVAFQLAQPTRACVLAGGQARVLMRQLSLPVSTMSQW